MTHHANANFWKCYQRLAVSIQRLADENFELLKNDPRHPSLHFKKVRQFWSVRVGIHYRAVGVVAPDGIVWFWIGAHAKYNRMM